MKVAISGKMGSGKTTLSSVFVEKYEFKRLNFAAKIREIAKFLLDMTDDDLFGPNKKRGVLQKIGHGFRTVFGPTIWIDALLNEMRKDTSAHYVVDDLRYKNEFDALKAEGFFMVRIEVPEELRKARIDGSAWREPDHPGETDLDDVKRPDQASYDGERSWDFTIIVEKNDIEGFKRQADKIYKYISETEKTTFGLDKV